jgi:hypothetical protein
VPPDKYSTTNQSKFYAAPPNGQFSIAVNRPAAMRASSWVKAVAATGAAKATAVAVKTIMPVAKTDFPLFLLKRLI